jgi:hypothetical protein
LVRGRRLLLRGVDADDEGPTGLTLTHFTTIYVLLGISIILEFARSIAIAYGDLPKAHRDDKRADS